MTGVEEAKARAAANIKAAEGILAKAEAQGRDLTAAEQREATDFRDQAADAVKALKQADNDAKVTKAINETLGDAGRIGAPSVQGTRWSKSVSEKLASTARSYGVKAITTGGIDIESPVDPHVVEIPAERAQRVLDLIPRAAVGSNAYAYLRQSVRTSNAAPVPDGEVKPTSLYTFEDVEERCRVVAHLSEAIPLRYFEDEAELQRILEGQMRQDLFIALEDQVVSGDGTGENFTGLLNTSGVVAVTFDSDILTTIRKARTALETLETPTAWVFHPSDLEELDLLRDEAGGAGTGQYLVNTSSLANIFGMYPRVASTAVPAGTAILGDWRQARLRVRQDDRLDADRSGDLFDRNQVKLRVEGRYGFDVLRPSAFAEVDLTAGT